MKQFLNEWGKSLIENILVVADQQTTRVGFYGKKSCKFLYFDDHLTSDVHSGISFPFDGANEW